MPPACSTSRKRQSFATCVDAPLGAREIFKSGVARGRVLTCVRPLMRLTRRGPRWESEDQVQFKPTRLKRLMVWTPPDGLSVPEWWCCKPRKEASMNQVSTVGLDLAKYIFQLHGADSAGAVVFRKRLRRGQLLAFLATLPP